MITNPEDVLTHLVTSSEDQTVKIHEFKDNQLTLLTSIKEHSLAVTSVDWFGNTLMSISDDRTVRLYSMPDAKLQRVLTTAGVIDEWHTLTYGCLN